MGLLRLDSTNDMRMVGIWGMGGLGKTTRASIVFDRIKNNFDGHCFVANVKDKLSRENVTEKIIQELFKDGNKSIGLASSVGDANRRRLGRMKVLLVLDDVDTSFDLNALLKSCSCASFSPGSRIIVTSRDSQVMRSVTLESEIYEVKQLENDEALRLLSWHAFGRTKPQEGYEKISEAAVLYAHGVPLALVVLGTELRGKEIEVWENALEKFNKISPPNIQNFLRISYDGLDREEKNIFLDVACFFDYHPREDVEYYLKCFGFHASIGIDRLADKSLLKVEKSHDGEDEIIAMHDLLVQMGKEIVAEEKESKGQQSRLWEIDDIEEAFTNKAGSENVEGIQIVHFGKCEIDIDSEAFIGMHKLRYLDIRHQKINCPKGLKFLPNSIKHLRWNKYPLKNLPSDYNADKLVALDMDNSKLEEISWSKPLVNLKRLSLQYCQSLTRISDLDWAPNLEELDLSGCFILVEIGSSLGNLNKLNSLRVMDCSSLSNLPELPCHIKELCLLGSGLIQLLSTIGSLTHLKELSLSDCHELESLPSSISSLLSLETISLQGCRNLREFTEDFGNLKSLKELDASYSGLTKLPQSIQNLQNLRTLNLYYCRYLIELPEELGNLKSLEELDVSHTLLTKLPQSTQNLQNLIELNLFKCIKLQNLPPLPPNLEMLYAKHLLDEESSPIIEQYISKVNSQPTKVHRVYVSGSQVPRWMKYRNECGSSVSLDLETVDFIFCVVLSSKWYRRPPKLFELAAVLQISETDYCTDRFPYKGSSECNLECNGPEEFFVVLWNSKPNCKFLKKVSFELVSFKLTLSGREPKIIKCGVHPIVNIRNHKKRKHPNNLNVEVDSQPFYYDFF